MKCYYNKNKFNFCDKKNIYERKRTGGTYQYSFEKEEGRTEKKK